MDSRLSSRLRLTLVLCAIGALFLLLAGQASATHVQCGDTITQDTTLDSDLIDCPGGGIVVGADNITLDLNGHTIDGVGVVPGAAGIAARGFPGPTSLTVQDGTIRDFYYGILFDGANSRFQRLEIANNLYGFYPGGREAFITRNYFHANEVGIQFEVASGTVIRKNVFERHSFAAVHTDGSTSDAGLDVLIEHNTFSDGRAVATVDTGCCGTRAPHILVRHNTITRAGFAGGITIAFGSGFEIAHNTILDVTGFGIELHHSADNEIVKNFIAGASVDGISINGCSGDGNIVARNEVSNNADDGIDTDIEADCGGAEDLLTKNTAHHNGDLGIEAVSGVDGGGNRAFGNGNPLQCLNVDCKVGKKN